MCLPTTPLCDPGSGCSKTRSSDEDEVSHMISCSVCSSKLYEASLRTDEMMICLIWTEKVVRDKTMRRRLRGEGSEPSLSHGRSRMMSVSKGLSAMARASIPMRLSGSIVF